MQTFDLALWLRNLRHFFETKRHNDYLTAMTNIQRLCMRIELNTLPEGQRVLVLSPHLDDEVIGCGGALIKHYEKGKEVYVIQLTSPEARSKNETKRGPRKNKADALRASSILGIKETIFLENANLELQPKRSLISYLKDEIKQLRPDVVYAPHPFDNHPDHISTFCAFVSASKETDLKYTVMLFEVWSPVFTNVVIDITDILDQKLEALKAYHLEDEENYVRMLKGLSSYRAATNMFAGFAEAFFKADTREFLSIFRNLI